jgi:hypothetical protein
VHRGLVQLQDESRRLADAVGVDFRGAELATLQILVDADAMAGIARHRLGHTADAGAGGTAQEGVLGMQPVAAVGGMAEIDLGRITAVAGADGEDAIVAARGKRGDPEAGALCLGQAQQVREGGAQDFGLHCRSKWARMPCQSAMRSSPVSLPW